jgi:hypothetical protein
MPLNKQQKYAETVLALENCRKDFAEANRLAKLRAECLLTTTAEKIVLEGKYAKLQHEIKELKRENNELRLKLIETRSKQPKLKK